MEKAPTPGLGFHWNDACEPANQSSSLWKGGSIQDTVGVDVPDNFPAFTPYACCEMFYLKRRANLNQQNNNIWGLQDANQLLSLAFNHELKETLGDDSGQNWDQFDQVAPAVQTWHYGEFDENDICTNGTLGPDGYVHLPRFLDVFPQGGCIPFRKMVTM